MQGVFLKFKIQVKKIVLNGRILPQLNVTECTFTIDPKKIDLDIGGSIAGELFEGLVSVIRGFFKGPIERLVKDQLTNGIPSKFNKFIKDSNGFLTMGDLNPALFPKGSQYANLTLDIQLDNDFKIGKNRIEFGFNGTWFNNDKGYVVPPV